MSTHGQQHPRAVSPVRRASIPQRRSSGHSSSSSTSSYVASAPPYQLQPPPPPDPFYGHEDIAKLSAKYVAHLFSCPEIPPPSASASSPALPPLANFIAYALHRTRLHVCVTFTALFLLGRLKNRFPAARGSSGHRLFISAFMIASKVVCDDTYSNKSWCVVGQGMFSLKEINQMEREMCGYLEWHLNVEADELKTFEADIRRDFGSARPKLTLATTTASAAPVASKAIVGAPISPPHTPPPITRSMRSATPSPTVCTPPDGDAAQFVHGPQKVRERAAFATVEAAQW